MSGLASPQEVLAARDAGFFSFLRKPLELAALRATVERLIHTNFGGPLASSIPAAESPLAFATAPRLLKGPRTPNRTH